MTLRLLALAGLLAAFLVAVGTAAADSGTFSGTITPTDCGPLQPVNVAPGDTTIVGAAAMTISANDIRLELYDPSGTLKVDGDSCDQPGDGPLPEPEPAGRHLEPAGLPVLGRPDRGALQLHGHVRDEQRPGHAGRDDTGVGNRRQRRDADAHLRRGQADVQPGDRDRPPAHRGRAAELPRSQEQHLLGERPLGHHDAAVLHPPLDRQRARVPRRQPGRPAPRCRPGRRRHRHHRRRPGQPLLRRPRSRSINLGTSVSSDDGNTWRKNPLAVQNVAVDRQWYAIDNGPTTSAADNTDLPRLPRDRGRHVHLLEPRLDRPDRPGRRARLAERIGEGAAPAGRRRDLRPASLRPEVPQPLLCLQRGQPRAHDDRPRGARRSARGSSSTTSRSRSRRAAAGPATSSPRRRWTAGATSTPPGSTRTTAASTTRPRPTRARAGRHRFASARRRPRPRSSSGPRRARPGRSRSPGTRPTPPASPTRSRAGRTTRRARRRSSGGVTPPRSPTRRRSRRRSRSSASPRSRCTTARSATRGSAARPAAATARWRITSRSTSTRAARSGSSTTTRRARTTAPTCTRCANSTARR